MNEWVGGWIQLKEQTLKAGTSALQNLERKKEREREREREGEGEKERKRERERKREGKEGRKENSSYTSWNMS